MFRTHLLFCCLAALILMAPVASADALDRPWQLRLDGVLVEPSTHFTGVDNFGIGADGAAGLSVALERRLSRRLGLELGALLSEPSIDLDAAVGEGLLSASNRIDFTSISLGLNVHLTPDKQVDLYLGPVLAHVDYSNIRFPARGELVNVDVSSSDNFTVGAQIGADVGFGDSPWSLNLLARYLDSRLDIIAGEGGAVQELEFDPLIAGVGIGYRF